MKLYLAPINKLCNQAFRNLCLENGANYVFTEMVKADELIENDKVQLRRIAISKENEPKTIVQIICENLETLEPAIKKIINLHPNLKEINYNMGCPHSSLVKNYSGAGILKNFDKIKQVATILIKSCENTSIRPSIKTRLGIERGDRLCFEVFRLLENLGITKIYIHGRYLSDNYAKPATHEEIGELIQTFPNLEIIANGDIIDKYSFEKLKIMKPAGFLIGRAALENPEIFSKIEDFEINKQGYELKDRISLIKRFLELCEKCEIDFSQIKCNLAYLTKGVQNCGELRAKINNCKNLGEIKQHFQ